MRLLGCPDRKEVRVYLEVLHGALAKRDRPALPDRIARGLSFWSLLLEMCRAPVPRAIIKRPVSNPEVLWSLFSPDGDPARADMLAALLRHKWYHDPNEADLIGLRIEALCCALRFDEALDLAQSYSELRIGNAMVPAVRYVRQMRRPVNRAPVDADEDVYMLVLNVMRP